VTNGLDQPAGPNISREGSALRASSIRRDEGVDAFQALQRVLYRSAKQDPERRFHALYDKLTRRDVMWRAWVDVATNSGASGVDVKGPRTRCRRCVGPLPGPRSVGAAEPMARALCRSRRAGRNGGRWLIVQAVDRHRLPTR